MLGTINKLLLLAAIGVWSAVAISRMQPATIEPSAITSAFKTFTTSSGNSGNTGSGTSTQTTGNTGTTDPNLQNSTENWAGYEATGGTYTGVKGSWVVPSASGSNEDTADATWIGIGGVSSNDLIQTGTQNEVDPDGSVTTAAFYELLPDDETTIPDLSVSAGDKMSASIEQTSNGLWQINLADETTGQNYSTEVNYDSSLSSAEWVEEDPSSNFGQVPLDNFGTVDFTGSGVTSNGRSMSLTGAGASVLNMINADGEPLASVSGISGGTSFTVTRTSASSQTVQSEQFMGGSDWTRRGRGIYRDYSGQTGSSDYSSGGGRGWYRRAFGF